MSFFKRFMVAWYAKLLNLYPRRFRAEFAEEMEFVFRDSLDEAVKNGMLALLRVCIRELSWLPLAILQEFLHEIHGKEMIVQPENTQGAAITTGQLIMGILPFFLFGLILIMFELPVSLFEMGWFISIGGFLFGGLFILPAVGFGIGWIKNFPRWSYPYVGMAVIWAFYIQNASTPGLNFFGIPIFGRELWGWRAWAPLAVAFTVALVVSRSFKPFLRFFVNLWKDWSIPSYFMAGVLPLLVFVAFDEIDRLYSLYFMVPIAIGLVSMVVLYLRSPLTWQRVLVLTIGVLVIIIPTVWGTNSYWLGRNGMHSSGARSMWILAGKIALIMLLPAWLELLRRSIGRLRTPSSG